ncbi:unannotated protein [freshwater metagenome]|uniref:Unannotated protein n=1 Tax=freshwater metagenome TaxID=449393 RepID=A0A6J6EZ85_9ZZZZ
MNGLASAAILGTFEPSVAAPSAIRPYWSLPQQYSMPLFRPQAPLLDTAILENPEFTTGGVAVLLSATFVMTVRSTEVPSPS